jgi:Leucine-rich repeat (LRR) protein
MNYYQKYLKYKNKYLQLQKGGYTTFYINTLTKIIRYIIIDLIASSDDKKLLLYNTIIYGGIIIFSKIKEMSRAILRNIIKNILDIIKSNVSSILYSELYKFINDLSVIDSIFYYYKFYSEIINLNIDSFLYKSDLYSINEFFNLIFILIKCNNVNLCNIYLNNRIIINTNISKKNIKIPNFLIEKREKLLNYLNFHKNDFDVNSNPPTLLSNLDYKSLNFNFTLFKFGELNNNVDTECINIENLQNINIIYDTNNINNIIELKLNFSKIDNPKLNIFEILYNCIDDIDILNNIFSECYSTTNLPTTYHVIRNSENNNFMDNAHIREILNTDMLVAVEIIKYARNGKILIVNLPRPLITSYNNMYKLDFFRSTDISLDIPKPPNKSVFWLYPSLTDHPGILLELNNYNRTIKLLSLNICHCNLYHTNSRPMGEIIPLDPNISYYFKRVFKIFYLLIKVLNKENIEICFLQEFLQSKELIDINSGKLSVDLANEFTSSSASMLSFLQNLLNLIGYRIYSTQEPGIYFNAIICKNNYLVEEVETHLLKGNYISNTFYCSLKYKNKLDLGRLGHNLSDRDTPENIKSFDLYIICNIANMFNLQRLCDKIVIMGDFNIGNSGDAFLNESLFSNYLILSGVYNNLDHALIITREQFNNLLNIVQVRDLLNYFFRNILLNYYNQPVNNIFFRDIYAPAYKKPMNVLSIQVSDFVDIVIDDNNKLQKWLKVYCKLIQVMNEKPDGVDKFKSGKKVSLTLLFFIADLWYGKKDKDGNVITKFDLNKPVPDNGKLFSLINYLQSPVKTDFDLPVNQNQDKIILKHLNGHSSKILKTNNFSMFINLKELIINNFNLKQIHLNAFTTSLNNLNLSNNNISELQPGIFDNLSLLAELDLSNNKISGLQPLYMYTIPNVGIKAGIFDNLGKLINLDLSNNLIQELQPCIFDNLPLLQQLNLDKNKIRILPRHIFNNLPLLQQLNLDNNKIIRLPRHIFDKLQSLQQLKLDNNEIRGLSRHIFDKLQLLQILYLNNNQIQELKPNTFNNLPELTHLYLNNNHIQKLKPNTFNNLPELTHLYLNNNQIQELQLDTFVQDTFGNNLSTLEELHLDHNIIQELQPGTFNNLPALKKLYLNNNEIKELQPDTFTQGTFGNNLLALEELYLDNNKIQEIQPDTFNNLLNLLYLILDHNEIQELHSSIFNNLTKLKYLYLNNLKIKNLPSDIFNNLRSLEFLYISPNEKLEILPKDIFLNLESLENLQIYMEKTKYNKPSRYYGISPGSKVKFI